MRVFLLHFCAFSKKCMYFSKFSVGRNLVQNLPKFCDLRKSNQKLSLVEKETQEASLKNKYENIHPNQNSPSTTYYPGNQHVPLLERENHRLKSGLVYVIVPRSVYNGFSWARLKFFQPPSTLEMRKPCPPGMAALIAILKQGNEVAIPPEAGNLGAVGSSHDWSVQIKPNKTRGLLSLPKHLAKKNKKYRAEERETQLTTVCDCPDIIGKNDCTLSSMLYISASGFPQNQDPTTNGCITH